DQRRGGQKVRQTEGVRKARPTGFEPATFGFVDRAGYSVGLVWTRFVLDAGASLVWTRLGYLGLVAHLLPTWGLGQKCCFAWKAAVCPFAPAALGHGPSRESG